ncbi:MAG TPA: hypothetical protein VL614_28660 [Acetobacteraceae bacterium]|nr:hypothetical protein [Acetobacteraceae bacterium]
MSQALPDTYDGSHAVQAVLELRAEAAQIDRIHVAGNERMATINNIPEPADIMMAQYSIPFCVALALYRDPRNPASFDQSALVNTDLRAMCRRVDVTVANPPTSVLGASKVTIRFRNGQMISREVEDFDGTPNRPLRPAELRNKFMMIHKRVWHGTGCVDVRPPAKHRR